MRTAIDWSGLLPMYEIREQREWWLKSAQRRHYTRKAFSKSQYQKWALNLKLLRFLHLSGTPYHSLDARE